jgi:hypothetical protein
MAFSRINRWNVMLIVMLAWTGGIGPAAAEEKSLFSPIIDINTEKGFIVVSADGKVFAVEASEAAKPHLGKLPISGMIDLVVELRGENPPLIKTWKVAGGESSCKIFDGNSCK